MAAFLSAVNREVDDGAVRVRRWSRRPPAAPRAAILELAAAQGAAFLVGRPAQLGQDLDRGRRRPAHRGSAQRAGALRAAARAEPAPAVRAQRTSGEAEVTLAVGGRLHLDGLSLQRSRLAGAAGSTTWPWRAGCSRPRSGRRTTAASSTTPTTGSPCRCVPAGQAGADRASDTDSAAPAVLEVDRARALGRAAAHVGGDGRWRWLNAQADFERADGLETQVVRGGRSSRYVRQRGARHPDRRRPVGRRLPTFCSRRTEPDDISARAGIGERLWFVWCAALVLSLSATAGCRLAHAYRDPLRDPRGLQLGASLRGAAVRADQ